MKRIYTLLMLSIFSMALFAQTNPNRILVWEKSGNVKGYLVENVDSVTFVKQEGRVAADVEFTGYSTGDTGDTLRLKVIRTKLCEGFRITVLPTNTANRLTTDASIASYLEQVESNVWYQDFTSGEMTGFDHLSENSGYTILTIGYDKYGIACSSSRADFTTPKKPVLGNPQVDYEIVELTQNGVTINLKPNADTGAYAYCVFGKGELQAQFEMFGPMFGFSNIGEMVYSWGIEKNGDCVATYNDLDSGKEYELFIQPLDRNGTYADMVCIPFRTLAKGGTGVAEVEITIGQFEKNENSYSQHINYKPNSETWLMHAVVRTKDSYDPATGEQEMMEYLKSDTDPQNPFNPFWDIYEEDSYVYTVNPNTTYIVFAMAKNANGEWGPLAQKEFTTANAPAAAPVKVGKNGILSPVINKKGAGQSQFSLPASMMKKMAGMKKGITLK